jgi:hypothetical protein
LVCYKGKKQKSSKLPAGPKAKRKELDGEDRESLQKGSVKPVSAGGFMTFPISQVYSE